MIWPYKIGIITACLFAAARAFQTASKIQNEVDLYSDYALCLALNGVSKPIKQNDQCEAFLRRLDTAAEDK